MTTNHHHKCHCDLCRPPRRQRLADRGGQYRPAIGTSTKDQSDRQRDAEALADFNAEWERIKFGRVS